MPKKQKIQKKYERKNKGITVIALIITIIILIILAGVVLSTITGEDGVIQKTIEARFNNNIAALREQIDLYKIGQNLDNITGIESYPVILDETMETVDKDSLSTDLKNKMLKWATTAGEGEIPTVDKIDYSKFYKLDKEKVTSAKEFEGDLYLVEVDNEYKVISIEGEEYKGETINVIIPIDDIADPEYITVANNTYKLYGDGTLKVVGELNANSGMTSDENSNINGIQELDLEKIAEGTGMVIDENIEIKDDIAKAYGVKKIYLSTGTIYVIDANDDLWAWGDNSYNKLGQGNSYLVTEPTKILEGRTQGQTGVKAKNVWAGATNTYVLDIQNRLWACGTNNTGELGQGNTNIYNNYVEVKIEGLDLNTVEIEKIEMSINQQYSSVIIKCNNGKVYGCGINRYGGLGIGNNTNQTKFICLDEVDNTWYNAKNIINTGIVTYVLQQDGTLYGCGNNSTGRLGLGDTTNRNRLTRITENIVDMEIQSSILNIIENNGNIYKIDNGTINKLNGLQDVNAIFLSNGLILSNNKMYYISGTQIQNYSHQYTVEKILKSKDMRSFISNNKVYIEGYPDITKPKEKSIYNLKEIMADVIFVQGNGSNINIVNKNGEIYESLTRRNTELANIKKLISSNTAKYALDNDGYLYAKGNGNTGMWGDISSKSNYIEVTKDGTNYFDNVKDIFTSKAGNSAIFITKDNKIYWAGSTSYIGLPSIEGDIQTVGSGKITRYPKEVNSTRIGGIKDKIIDIKYSFINSGGIYGTNTIIQTTDGKIYTYSANNANMTGLGKTTTDFEELKIKEGTTVEQIETEDGLSLAILSNGEVYGWGYNTYGILGEGYEIGGIYPTPVKLNLNNINYMSLGEGFAIFASKTGEVYGIGKNDYGQLGTGDNTGASTFVRCPELEKE